MKQRTQREKLAKAVAIAEQQYKQVLEEIQYLESPFDPEERQRLDETIDKLCKEIQYISNLPDNSSGIGKRCVFIYLIFFCFYLLFLREILQGNCGWDYIILFNFFLFTNILNKEIILYNVTLKK